MRDDSLIQGNENGANESVSLLIYTLVAKYYHANGLLNATTACRRAVSALIEYSQRIFPFDS